MITIDFSRKDASFTECIYTELKNGITQGLIQPNEKLPSKRALADHLGVSVITVQNAYEQLIAEGYVYSQEKKGYFATPLEYGTVADKFDTQLLLPSEKQPQSELSVGSVSALHPIDLHSNSTSTEKFPFTLWAKLLRGVLNGPQEHLLQPIPPQGLTELQNAIAGYVRRFRNMHVEPHQIVIGAGTEYLYSLIVQLLGRNKTYAVENPGYTKIAAIFSANGARCIPVDIDASGISPEGLSAVQADVAHVSPSHHFPTGIVMPVKRRRELLAWAEATHTAPPHAAHTRYIIEDDYDSEFRFTGRPIETLQSADTAQRVIYMNTFSKTLAPSFRISYMILPLPLSSRFRTEFSFYSCTVSSIEQLALAEFIRLGFYEKHLIRMKNYYRNIRNELIFALEHSPLKPLIEIQEEHAGLHFLLSLKTDKTDAQLKEKIVQQGISVSFLTDYTYRMQKTSVQDSKTHILIINYSGIRKELIPRVMERLCKAVLNE